MSSLLHAATMVCAGVLLLVRTSKLLAGSLVLHALALISCVTMGAAALTAIRLPDMKRVVALSTLSQLGYMVMGIAALSPEASAFHL